MWILLGLLVERTYREIVSLSGGVLRVYVSIDNLWLLALLFLEIDDLSWFDLLHSDVSLIAEEVHPYTPQSH